MIEDKFYIEVDCEQNMHIGEMICGDVFLSERIKKEKRIVAVLSDGMGSGVKANVLATLTASMALNFIKGHRNIRQTAEIIMDTLPVCSTRKVSYSTFTIIDIEFDGTTHIIEYDNPKSIIMRGTQPFDPEWKETLLESETHKGKALRTCTFLAQKEDRIFFWSDGVSQSGMGTKQYPFGWGQDNVEQFIYNSIVRDPFVSAKEISKKVVAMALRHDNDKPLDDTSCSVIYFRQPRKLLICTGPPYNKDKDTRLAVKVQEFEGKKIISGGTTAEIIAEKLALLYRPGLEITDYDLPPISYMEGINLVTEGILTLGKASQILENFVNDSEISNGPADEMVNHLLKSDKIHFIVGTCINTAHQDPSLPQELEIRRTVVKRIINLLENKFLKDVTIEFI